MIRLSRAVRSVAAVAAAALAVAPLLAGTASAADSHALISGSGSSWSANAVNQWIADVQSDGLQVVYTPNGDASGRQDFANTTSDFAVTAIGYQGSDPLTHVSDTSDGRPYAYLPIVAGGTSFPYQIKVHGEQVRNLRLSGETLAKIFTGQITNWDDKAITQDNDGHALPSLPIIPVVQSEGSGATYQLTRYLWKEYPSIWNPFECKGLSSCTPGATEYFPQGRGSEIAQNGSDGAMNYVSSASANGSIGYVEYSYALASNYPVAKLLNSAGYYTLPTQYNVAVALEQAQINENTKSSDYLLQNLDYVYIDRDPRTYPLSSYSYMIIPTGKYPSPEKKITTAKRQTIADFLYYSICQGQSEVGPIGYSPLPVNLVQAGFGQIQKLKQADPGVDLTKRDVSTCHNPTFIAGHPDDNYLAKIAPMPPACDKQGATPCAAGVTPDGTGPTPTSSGKSRGSATTVGGSSTGGSTGTGAATKAGGAVAKGGTATAGTVAAGSGTVAGGDSGPDDPLIVSSSLAGYRTASAVKIIAPIAVVLLAVLVVGPPVLARRLARRRS